ncbi:MAG: hypothetical protein ACE5GL_09530 [Calditrichia bacterium]
MKKIEFLYFDGCPSWKEALANLKKVLQEEHIEAELELINVDSPEKAAEVGFFGSPSIQVDGVDMEGRTGDFSYSCRIYEINGRSTGLPDKQYIRERLLGEEKEVVSIDVDACDDSCCH